MGIYNRKVKVKSEVPDSKVVNKKSDLPEILRRYLRPVMIFSGIILSVVAFFSIGNFFKQESIKKESDMAYFALKSNNGHIENLKSLKTLSDHYRAEGPGPDSVMAASLFFHEGNTDESLDLYENIAEKGEHNIIKSIGLMGMGYSLEAKGKFMEAIEKFKQIKSIAILKYYQYLAALSVARCYEELNDTQKALEEYNLIKQEFDQIRDKEFINSRVAALKS